MTDPNIIEIKASVQLPDGVARVAHVTLHFDDAHRTVNPQASATVEFPDGNTVRVDSVDVGYPHVVAALRLPYHGVMEAALQRVRGST